MRAGVSVALVAAVYGIVAHVARPYLPTRIWLAVHYIEDVELLPTYSSLGEELTFLLRAGILVPSVLVSTARVLAGFVLGAVVGTAIGLLTGWRPRVEWVADPWLTFFRYTPALALLPLYVVWFGFGEVSKVLLIASSVAVVALVGAHQGVRGVPTVYLDAACALGADRRLVFRRIVWPAAVPSILASLRVALGLAWVTIVVAELIDPRMPSLGYLLALAGAYPRVPTMMIGLGMIGLLVLAGDVLALGCYRASTRWMRRGEGDPRVV